MSGTGTTSMPYCVTCSRGTQAVVSVTMATFGMGRQLPAFPGLPEVEALVHDDVLFLAGPGHLALEAEERVTGQEEYQAERIVNIGGRPAEGAGDQGYQGQADQAQPDIAGGDDHQDGDAESDGELDGHQRDEHAHDGGGPFAAPEAE